ncbi:hypothetical protein NC653_004796 [Populus alba x Populus x berolinensis]|uniref:Uncharacterized protein n=1 Tax=Populus alba x Populus x berolinensis TaxID=444605 RepID=A0AAD6RUX0_9ROSI|nr:hypothetical protein NC653_004796 [Populus alba x Populus x berolinensis]
MYSDVSSCNSYNYGDALYWDARYVQEAESFDWSPAGLRLSSPLCSSLYPPPLPLVSSWVGCGNAPFMSGGHGCMMDSEKT